MPGSKLLLNKPKLTEHPVDIGQRTEGAILFHLIRRGYRVLPWGANQRYDLVLDVDERFLRAQCKTGRLRDGSIVFNTQSIISSKTKNVLRGYVGEADIFLVHCPSVDQVYLVPVDDAPKSAMALRLVPCRNKQREGVNWARDYVLPG